MPHTTVRSLGYYVDKMTPGEKRCRRTGRHVWPTDDLEGRANGSLPPGIKVIGESWEGAYRLRVIEWCDSCGSEGVSFRHGNGHYDSGSRRRIIYGPDHVAIPLEVQRSPKLIRQAEDTASVAKLFVKAAKRTAS